MTWPFVGLVAPQPDVFDDASAKGRRRLEVLSGEVVWTEHTAQVLKCLGRLTLGMQNVPSLPFDPLLAKEGVKFKDFILLSDGR